MAAKARYIFIASMDVDPAKEDLFNEVYDTEHVPLLSESARGPVCQALQVRAPDHVHRR